MSSKLKDEWKIKTLVYIYNRHPFLRMETHAYIFTREIDVPISNTYICIHRERECVYILKYFIISSNKERNNLNIKSADFYLIWNYFFIPRFFLDFRLKFLDKNYFSKYWVISEFA